MCDAKRPRDNYPSTQKAEASGGHGAAVGEVGRWGKGGKRRKRNISIANNKSSHIQECSAESGACVNA